MCQREKFAFIRPHVMRPGVRMGKLLGVPWMSGGDRLLCCSFRLFNDNKKLRKASGKVWAEA